MVDIVDSQTRSRMMSSIRGKDTRPELALRRALHKLGLRYRLHAKELLGKPDLIFPRHRAALFVHGCFWHRHHGCRFSTTPATRREFWIEKFSQNEERDRKVKGALIHEGWRVATIWECAIKRFGETEVAGQIESWLVNHERLLEIPSAPIVAM